MSWRCPRVPRHSCRLERVGRGTVDITPASFLTPRRFQSNVTAIDETSQAPPRRARHSQILDQDISSTIKVDGLIRSVRKQKKIAFARLNDGSTLEPIQAVFPDPALAKEYVLACGIRYGNQESDSRSTVLPMERMSP